MLGGFATLPLIALVSSPPLIAACGGRPPETPLAHLYGHEWVQGAYKMYSTKYAAVQTSADETSHDVYRVLAQKGIAALDALQSRDVPFYVRVDPAAQSFAIERKVPERLTFTADMTEADRKNAEAGWKKARDNIHLDYVEVKRLDQALTRLLGQVQRIRNAIEEGKIEQYRIVGQLAELKADPTKLPYQLPYQVTPKDYEEILLLLLERLEDDRARLGVIEADVVAVGMTVRSTDANSATMAASIRKVLLAVIEDGTAKPREPLFPADQGEREKLLSAARALQAKIESSAEYTAWRKAETEKQLAALGAFLQVLDTMTGLPTSQVYRTVLNLWRGDHDYLTYLKTIAGFVPHGGAVARTIVEAIEYTEKARQIGGTVVATVRAASNGGAAGMVDALAAEAKAQAAAQLTAQTKGVVLNTASRFALERADKQLSFFKDKAEVGRVTDALAQTELMRGVIPGL
ncbi:MAG: hypothetical protein JWP87_706 [Labilithrix sp.]|nr:hypothetical protein [Labilithrix sp.]